MNIRQFINKNAAQLAASGTWLIIFGITLKFLLETRQPYAENLIWVVIAMFTFLGCFLMLTYRKVESGNSLALLLLVQLGSAIACMWLVPANFLAILTIIWISVLSSYCSFRVTLAGLVVVLFAFYGIFSWHWQMTNMLVTVLLYGTFHGFAILMAYQTRVAEESRDRAEALNQQLLATQQLLGETSRQQERTRIARDLHDLLGHHLTALLINLQVAERKTEGETKEQIERCYSLAKLLMSDVREAVSEIRSNQSVDLEKVLIAMAQSFPDLQLELKFETKPNLDELNQTQVIASCVQEAMTNSIKHSNGSSLTVQLTEKDGLFNLAIFDDGQIRGTLRPGNGLTGMKERVTEAGGTLNWTTESGALELMIQIPRSEVD